MKFIGDFHIHSHFSLATSKELKPEFLDYWAAMKGIRVVGTGDFTHPGWLAELKEKLDPAEEGLFRLKNEYRTQEARNKGNRDARFLLTTEISNIYKKDGKVRKVHNVVFAPGFEVAEKIQRKLLSMGFNLTSDGRPILGLDSKKLLEICLECSEDIFFVPAHIWTPWFSVLGSKSGFDSVEECFEDLSDHISAVETGLSTDPPMNWMVSSLDKYTLLANSDAHSPEKLGRNANLFNTDISYSSIIDAMKTGDPAKFLGTIDFFPEEGKYHYDGHRKCGICWSPLESLEHDNICPVCGKEITIGVLNRVAQLADRDDVLSRPNQHSFHSLIPLKEILAELEDVGPNAAKIGQQYDKLVRRAGSEFNLLLHYELPDVARIAGDRIAEAISRMRKREVYIQEGFDGEFGVIKVFGKGEKFISGDQHALFEESQASYRTNSPRPLVSFNLEGFRKLKREKEIRRPSALSIPDQAPDLFTSGSSITAGLNEDQKQAAEHLSGPALILAGPGTGKTRVLTTRIANLILNHSVNPENILAVTFTNKAAGEMKDRLTRLIGNKRISDKIRVNTFHAFGLSVLKFFVGKTGRTGDFVITDNDERLQIIREITGNDTDLVKNGEEISKLKQQFVLPDQCSDSSMAGIYRKYEENLVKHNAFDMDDLICKPVLLFQNYREILIHYRNQFKWILVDEYQDVNFAQYQLIRQLMPDAGSNLFAIGDANQAIYGFRGADVQFIRRFKTDYPDARILGLTTSYRCSDYILKASGRIIGENEKFLSGLQKGVRLIISENATEKSEAEFIARTIEQKIGGVGFFSMDSGITFGNKEKEIESLSDFAILCRISKQMPAIEKALKDHNIPYQKVGEDSLLQLESVKTLIEILKMEESTDNRKLPVFSLKNSVFKGAVLLKVFEEIKDKSFGEKAGYLIEHFFRNHSPEQFAFDHIREVAVSVDNTRQLVRQLSHHSSIDGWKPGAEAVNLMTLHASKGLEFNCVIIPGCEEGLIPFSLYKNMTADTDEEKRLLYVGMTRAKNYLYLTHAKKRFLTGKEYTLIKSTFLNSIEEELIESQKHEFIPKPEKEDKQLELF